MPEPPNLEDIGRLLQEYAAGDRDADSLLSHEAGKVVVAGGIDMMMLPTDSWGAILMGLIEENGRDIVSDIRSVYRQTCRGHAQMALQMLPADKLGAMFSLWTDLGYAEVEDVILHSGEDETEVTLADLPGSVGDDTDGITVRCINTVTARGVLANNSTAEGPVCTLWPAYLQGSLEAWIDREIVLEETACQATGAEHCRYIMHIE